MGKHSRALKTMTVEERRKRVSELYMQGHVQFTIAEIIGIARTTVEADLAAVREEWKTQRLVTYDEAIAREVASLEYQESELWAAWLRSYKEDVRTVVVRKKRLLHDDIDGEDKTRKRKRSSTLTVVEEIEKIDTRQLLGDPRFMAELTRCRELRYKLMGWLEDEPIQPAVVNIWQQLQEARFDRDEDTIEERLKMIETRPTNGFVNVTEAGSDKTAQPNDQIQDSAFPSNKPTNTSE